MSTLMIFILFIEVAFISYQLGKSRAAKEHIATVQRLREKFNDLTGKIPSIRLLPVDLHQTPDWFSGKEVSLHYQTPEGPAFVKGHLTIEGENFHVGGTTIHAEQVLDILHEEVM